MKITKILFYQLFICFILLTSIINTVYLKRVINKQKSEILAVKLVCAEKLQKSRQSKQRIEDFIYEIFKTPFTDETPIFTKEVKATAYSASIDECNANPEVTASMNPSRVGAIAISRDLEKQCNLTLGQFVIVKEYGLMRIEDRMNVRIKNTIDILHANKKAAINFGKRKATIIWLGRK